MGDTEKRWPAVTALLTAGILPATTARPTAHVGLAGALAVHVLVVASTGLLILFVAAWVYLGARVRDGETAGPIRFTAICSTMVEVPAEVNRTRKDPWAFLKMVGGSLAATEIGVLALAVLVTPWGARDERERSSFRRALCRTWMHTPHALLATALFCMAMLPLLFERESARQAWMRQRPVGLKLVRGSPAWEAHGADLGKWSRAPDRWPWRVRHAERAATFGLFAALTWYVWALLRSVGVRTAAPAVEHPPLCELCGYNLTRASPEGRCPECGEPVSASLEPEARPGAPWERRSQVGWWRAWWRCAIDPIVRPTRFGLQLRASGATTAYRSFLAMHLVGVGLVGGGLALWWQRAGPVGSAAGGRVIRLGIDSFQPHGLYFEMGAGAGLLIGCFLSGGVLAATLLVAGLVALFYRERAGRNLIPVSMQAASYLSVFLLFWTAFAFGLDAAIIAASLHWIGEPHVAALAGYAPHLLGAWALPNFICLVVYVWLAARITSAARYANR